MPSASSAIFVVVEKKVHFTTQIYSNSLELDMALCIYELQSTRFESDSGKYIEKYTY